MNWNELIWVAMWVTGLALAMLGLSWDKSRVMFFGWLTIFLLQTRYILQCDLRLNKLEATEK